MRTRIYSTRICAIGYICQDAYMKPSRDRRLTAMDVVFNALADPTRLRILALLAGGEICVCDIHDTLGIPQPRASRHLSYLRRAGLVETRKQGLWVHYRLAAMDDAVLRTLVAAVTHCLGHVDVVARDRQRLEKTTGCCCVVERMNALDCCSRKVRAPAVAPASSHS